MVALENYFGADLSLAAHTISLASVWVGFGNGPLYIPSGRATGTPSRVVGSVLLASYPSELPKFNSAICELFSVSSLWVQKLSRIHILQSHCHGSIEAPCPG